MKPERNPILLTGAGLLGLLVLGLAGFWLAAPDRQAAPVTDLPAAKCRPVASRSGDYGCHTGNEQLALALRLGGPLRYLTAFPVELRVSGIEPEQIDAVVIEFEMSGMEMGLNRFRLQPVTADVAREVQTAAVYRGTAVLPVCVSGRVDWLARVRVVTAAAEYRARFGFSVSKGS